MEVGLKGHLIPAPDGGRNFEAVLFNFFFFFSLPSLNLSSIWNFVSNLFPRVSMIILQKFGN